MNDRCDYADCPRIPVIPVQGWTFCRPHYNDHRALVTTDLLAASSQGPHRPANQRIPRPGVVSRYSGRLGPCGTYLPVLDVLDRTSSCRTSTRAAS